MIAPIVAGAVIVVAGYLVLAQVTLEAYCWPPSVGRGEPVELHVSTDAPTFDVEVAREGAESEPVWSAEGIAGRSHDTPDDASSNGCGWPPALEIPVGATGGRGTTPSP